MQRAFLILALFIGVAIDGFFAVVNFYPVAPARSRGPRQYVVASLDPVQAAWFQQNLLDEYNDAHGTNILVRAVDEAHVEAALSEPDVLVAAMSTVHAIHAADSGHTTAFADVIPAAQLASDSSAFRGDLMRTAQYHDRQAFLPRAVALDVAVYRVSKVRDAMLHWRILEREIDAALRTVNGRGLPAGYSLEREPTSWDAYDQFVLAYFWAHRSYDGTPARARFVRRTGLSIESQFDVVSGIYRAGGSDATLAQHDSPAELDALQWDALYHAEGLFAEEMFVPGGLDDEDVRAGISHGDFYLASVDQLQAFTLHGGSHRGAPAQVADEDDLGFVAMPRFESLELDAAGHPARAADSFSFRRESVWVLPAHGPPPRNAYRLVRWVGEAENHARECEALGTLPIRTDVIRERATLFRVGWMQDIFEAGLVQWRRSQPIPAAFALGTTIDDAILWDRVVTRRAALANQRDAIAAATRAPIDRDAAERAAASVEAEHRKRQADRPKFKRAPLEPPPLRERVVVEGVADAGVDASADAMTDAMTDARGDATGDAGGDAPHAKVKR